MMNLSVMMVNRDALTFGDYVTKVMTVKMVQMNETVVSFKEVVLCCLSILSQ